MYRMPIRASLLMQAEGMITDLAVDILGATLMSTAGSIPIFARLDIIGKPHKKLFETKKSKVCNN